MKSTSSSAETFDELVPRQVLGDFALEKTLATMAHRDLLTDAKYIINTAQTAAYRSVNAALVYRNWHLGKRIAEEVLKGEGRAEYGKGVITNLAEELTNEYGKGFDFTNLYKFLEFYHAFPILDSLSLKSGITLPWTHYRKLLQVKNEEARLWYINEAASEGWSVRTLQRNISSQYYERTLLSQHKEVVREEMHEITRPLKLKKGEGDNPTLGILLCADTDADIARYSILKGNEQLFATKYMLCLPSDEELRAEIETQKQIYFEQFANGQKGGHK